MPWTDSAVLCVALGLRLLHVLSIRHAYFFTHLQTERLRYHLWALSILSRTQRTSLPFDQAPGYPYLVAGIYATFGPRVTAVAVVQAVLDAITCVAIARVGRRCFGAPAGLVAGLLAVAYGSFIYCTGELESATPFVCAVTVAVALALAPAWPRWLLSGACWALALLLRRRGTVRLPRHARGCVASRSSPRPPCWFSRRSPVRTWSRRARWCPTSRVGGFNLWLGNNPDADGVNPFLSGPREGVVRAVAAQATDAVDADRLYRQRAVSFWRDEPRAAIRLL